MHTGVSAPEALVLICARNDLFYFNRIGWRQGCVRGMSGVCHPLLIQCPAANQQGDETKQPPPSSNFIAKTLGLIWQVFSWTAVLRMRLQIKILFGIKGLPIRKKIGKTCFPPAPPPPPPPPPPPNWRVKPMTCPGYRKYSAKFIGLCSRKL